MDVGLLPFWSLPQFLLKQNVPAAACFHCTLKLFRFRMITSGKQMAITEGIKHVETPLGSRFLYVDGLRVRVCCFILISVLLWVQIKLSLLTFSENVLSFLRNQ